MVLLILEEPEEAEAHRDQTHTRGGTIINTTAALHPGNRTEMNRHQEMPMRAMPMPMEIKMMNKMVMRMKRIR